MQNLLAKKIPSTTPFALISSIRRLLSTSPPSAEAVRENSPLESNFAFEYLVNSCGLSVEKAIKASKRIPHLKSPEKSDSVLHYLRQIGLDDAGIKRAVTIDASILCASLENTIKPALMNIQEIGFSPSQITQLLLLKPQILYKDKSLEEKIKFWMTYFGSLEGVLSGLKRYLRLLSVSVEKVIEPNISFLEGYCGISPSQMRKMIMRRPSIITYNPNKLKEAAQRAEELGFPRGSRMFVYALQIATSCSQNDVDAKISNLKKLGFSKMEIDSMIKKQPMLLTSSDERIHSIIGFLTSEAGLDLPLIALHPKLFTQSLERRLIPRHYVLKSLKSKGLCQNWSFSSAMELTEVRFEDKFLRPCKDKIPEVFEAYEAARSGKISLKDKTVRCNKVL